MHGSGLTNVALLADHENELNHFMLQRLLRRSGMWNEHSFHLGTTSEPYLLETLQRKGIKTIVPLGERALRQTLGETNIERWRGRVKEHPHLPGVWVAPTFAPSALLAHRGDDTDDEMRHPPRFQGTWIWDVAKAVQVAKHGFTRAPVDYLCDPSVEAFDQWIEGYFRALAADPDTLLSFDIETPYKLSKKDEADYEEKEALFGDRILRISFAYKTHHAVSVAWTALMMPGVTRLLAAAGGKVTWNGATFDVPKVEAAGHPVNGVVYDYMDGWHVYQSDLDKGLEFVSSFCTDILPWKHTNVGDHAVVYSCIDADAALRNALCIKQWLIAGGQWDAFYNHSVRLMPILYRAGRHGNKIDMVAQAALIVELDGLKASLSAEAQPLVPRALKPRAMRKTCPDSLQPIYNSSWDRPQPIEREFDEEGGEWDILFESEDIKFCTACGFPASNKTEHFKGGAGPVNPKTGNPTRVPNKCKLAKGAIAKRSGWVPRYYEVLPFNTNSGDQMRAYIKWAGHPMGVDKKDAQKETADAKHLAVLQKRYGAKHPIYKIAMQMAQVSKTRGTYCPVPDDDQLIHTTYKNNTSTWRLASAALNMQNWGNRDGNPYAKRARKQIIARPGHKLVQIDSASVEAVMLGYFMGDRHYMATASKGIHSWLTCMEMGIEFTDANVEMIKAKHKAKYNAFKMGNHMTNYGGGAYVLWQSQPELFPTRKDAERVQDRIFELIPKLKAFHHEVRVLAQKETVLTNPWGHKHYFYDVFTIDKMGKIKWGKDSKRVVAYKPQSANGCFQRDNILLLSEEHTASGQSLVDFFPANLSVHDSACLDTPAALVEEVADILARVFTRPIPQMQGLRIGAEIEVGDNWGDMESIRKIHITDYDDLEEAA